MRKTIIAVSLSILLAFSAYAESAADDTTSRDFSELRKKMSKVKRELDLLVKDMVSDVSTTNGAALTTFGEDVSVDILENDKDVIVKADLPGMQKDKISVTLESGRLLKISGTREMLKNQSSPGVVRQERFYGNFQKVLELPCEVMNTGIGAVYKDGVLEITIPKKAQGKEEKVKINVK
ncbi:MAG: Hsp20/alpha crystallin family protein [Candidatus Omnitrophica bacterium]|nr:Hsp20/alpha crystallin family protein [Candidatus Omnitrophota bacterium]